MATEKQAQNFRFDAETWTIIRDGAKAMGVSNNEWLRIAAHAFHNGIDGPPEAIEREPSRHDPNRPLDTSRVPYQADLPRPYEGPDRMSAYLKAQREEWSKPYVPRLQFTTEIRNGKVVRTS